MRILVAPDRFSGSLSSVEVAEAVAEGWRRHAPADELELTPMGGGGPGFVDVLAATLGGDLHAVTVTGPHHERVPATLLVVGHTAYVESAQACGLALTGGAGAATATTYGVGELLLAAVDAGARRLVVGVGATGTNDGGAGLLAALGATADRPLDEGGAAIAGVTQISVPTELDVELVLASDADSPLTGLFGATKVEGPDKGLTEAQLPALDGALQDLAGAAGRRLALAPGAGAGGGLGYGLLLLGAERRRGIDVVAEALGLAERARYADLVVTGEGAFDFSSRAGAVPYGVAEIAAAAARPCVLLAGRVDVGSREMRALGIESAYSLVDLVGEERALTDPARSLVALAERVARSWSH